MTVKIFRFGDGILGSVARAVEMQVLNFALLPLHALPSAAALELGRATGRAAAMALPRYRRRAEEQLRAAFPAKSAAWAAQTAIACFEHFGQMTAEMLKAPRSA